MEESKPRSGIKPFYQYARVTTKDWQARQVIHHLLLFVVFRFASNLLKGLLVGEAPNPKNHSRSSRFFKPLRVCCGRIPRRNTRERRPAGRGKQEGM